MSADKEKIKPNTDIELFLNNNANHCDWKILKNDSGAGANAAASRVDLKFPPTDPLSEIVWSPDKGLSLKCADSSFVDKNSSLFRHVRQSCSGGKSATDKPIDDVFVKPIAMSRTKSDAAAEKVAPTVHPLSGSDAELECKTYEEINIGSGNNNEDKMNTAERAPNLPDDQDGNPKEDWEENTGDQTNIGTDNKFLSAISDQIEQRPSPGIPSNEGIDAGAGKKAVATDEDLHTLVQPIIEYKYSGAPRTNVASSSRSPFVKMESSAENDLRTVGCEAADIVNEIKDKSQDNEMMAPCENVLPVLDSPCNSRIRMTKNKGKENSLSDGVANVRLSMDNDSHSSVESCNSTGFFSTGMKKRKFQQQLIIGSKRVKKNSEETSGSKSYIEQDSSFKNWISSMVKGLSQSTQANSNTLALTFANPDHHHDVRFNEKFITCKMNQDPEPKNTGFKSIFQSMYCPSSKNVETKMFHREEGNEDLEPGNTAHGIDATPITCYAVNSSLSNRYLQPNKNEASIGGCDTGPVQPNIRPLNFFNSHESRKNHSVENENCSILDLSKDKEEMASHSSSTRKNTNNTENVDSIAPSERKEEENICHRRDTLGSLWLTRFYPKSTAALTISDHLNERDGSKIPDLDKHVSYLNNCKIEETGEQPANDIEASTGLKEDEGNNDHKSKYMLSNFSSSPGFTNSEQMASTFARRFGAIKHTIPTNKADSTSHELEVKTLVGDCIPNQKHFITSNEVSARPHTDQADRILSGGADHQADQNINLKWKSNENITFKTECKSSYKKHCGSSSKENKFKEKPVSSPSRLAERKISHVPEGIFDAVKKLQLSRNDILKWINAHGSISQLDGFFLRLRLGRWEEGLGGTGYHVACIHETGRHSSEQHTRKSLSVKIGGIKCIVESQYISNQSFLEEEIMEWWSSTSEASVEIPSEEDLIAKSKKKQILGL